MKKKLAVMLAVASIASASSAMAATIYNSQGVAFPAQSLINSMESAAGVPGLKPGSYKIAYEVYNNSAGATTIAADGTSFGQLNIALSQPMVSLQNVNVRVSNGTADFNSAGPGFNRYGVCRLRVAAAGAYLTDAATAGDIAGAVCDPLDIVATMPPSGTTTANLGLQVIDATTTPGYTALQADIVTFNASVDAADATYAGSLLDAAAVTAYKTAVAAARTLFLATVPINPLTTQINAVTAAANLVVAGDLTTGAAVTTAQTNLTAAAAASNITAPAHSLVRLVQWNDNGGTTGVSNNSQLDGDEALTNGASIWVYPNLGPTCSTYPIIQMTFSSSGGESTAFPINFAYITPQFGFTAPSVNTLNAELNSDVDFTKFTMNSNDSLTTMTVVGGYGTALSKSNFFTITNPAPGAANSLWINYASVSPAGLVKYDLTSAALEPGIGVTGVQADSTACTPNATVPVGGTRYDCSVNSLGLVGDHSISITLNGTAENNPTNWTISNFSAAGVCPATPAPSIGSWYGGIEAIVPFVKAAPGYETYIKLFNRYAPSVNPASPAKVYVSNMNQVQASIVTSIKQLGAGSIKNSLGVNDNSAIPVNGFITITATDLGSVNGVLSTPAQGSIIDGVTVLPNGATELVQGVPIKFLIRVPAQMGTMGGTPFTTANVNTDGTVGNTTIVGTVGTANLTGSAAGVATASVSDPYITGFVVSTYNTGAGQRTVPLTFKSFKQGQYN